MSNSKNIHINPTGHHISLDQDYVNPLKKNIKTRTAQHEDSIKDIKSHQLQLTLWSLSTGLIILGILSMISKIK